MSCAETLFVNVAFNEVINELASDGSDAMLRHLYSRIDSSKYQMRLKWQPGTVVIRDNWVAQRYARGDHYPSFCGVQRVTVGTPRYASLGLN